VKPEINKKAPKFVAHMNRIVARRDKPTTSVGRILLSDSAVQYSIWATILALGDKAKAEGFDVGDRILVHYQQGFEHDFGDENDGISVVFCSPENILAKAVA
jgi:co-chaperonin GroES (HSP10)